MVNWYVWIYTLPKISVKYGSESLIIFVGAIMGEIIVLEIKFNFGDKEDAIYPAVLMDESEMILVDCGYTGFLPLIEKAFEEKGLDISRLTTVVITHHDHDHMGSLKALREKYPYIKIVADDMEAPYIMGEKKALRLEQAEVIQELLPEEEKAFGLAFCEMLRKVEPCPVDIIIKPGEELNWCGGCQIIDTPGHTAGHISLYMKEHKTIIAGDAAVLDNEKLIIANPQYAFDINAAEKSLKKLEKYDAHTYICYHGGVYRQNQKNVN